MATGSTANYNLPYPLSTDPVNVASDIQDLSDAIDTFLTTPAFIGNITVNAGSIVTSSATASLFNTGATTLNLGGAATTMNVGASAGQVNIRGNLNIGDTKVYEINDVTVLSASALGTGVVGSSLTSVGTIGTGVWQGTAINAEYGGTGLTSYTIGDIVYASASTTLAKLAGVATGNALISGGVGAAPSWGKVGLATHISGVLPAANGGTGVDNGSSTITLGGSFTTSGAFTTILTITGNTSITLPTSGTVATTGSPTFNVVTTLNNQTGTVTVGLGTGATTSGNTKTINIGQNGLSGSTTNINLGSSVSGATGTITANHQTLFPAATTSTTSIRIPHGTAPSAPTNGDIWTTTSGLFAQINGATEQYAKLASPTFSGTVSSSGTLLVMSSDTAGSPSSNVSFRVERGTSADVELRWNETGDSWQFTNDGTTFYDIPTSAGGGTGLQDILMFAGM